LNKYAYNNSDKIHNIVLGGRISAISVPIPNTEFEIKKAIDSFEYNGITYTYVFKDASQQDIHIEDQNVNVSTLDTLVRNDLNYLPGEWEKALNDAENDFKHLEFGPEVRTSLKQYSKKIEEEYNKLSESGELKTLVELIVHCIHYVP